MLIGKINMVYYDMQWLQFKAQSLRMFFGKAFESLSPHFKLRWH